jgi:hypothetical protein
VNFSLIEGEAHLERCTVCGREGIGGTAPYISASSGESREPEKWYTEDSLLSVYCSECAAKLTAEDPTRSVSQFYTDTEGTEIDHKKLSDYDS